MIQPNAPLIEARRLATVACAQFFQYAEHVRAMDNSDYYGPFDWCVSQWKTQILSGKRSDFIQLPDFRAISDLIEAGGRDVAAEAYGSISVQYSCDALHILRLEGIAPPELPLTSF